MHDVHTLLGAKEAEELKLRAAAVAHFLRAADKNAAAREIVKLFGSRVKGMTLKSLYRLAKQFDGTMMSLLDRRQLRRISAGGLMTNKEFVAYWHQLCLENKRATAPAYRELFRRLQAGDRIPGFGDWKDIFAAENGGIRPAPDRACPYQAGLHMPKGWTLRNLNRIKPDEFALVAARKGTMEAVMEHLPDVKRTRVGLKSCRVVQIDDMWYEHKVQFGKNRKAQRVLEMSMIDVATGMVFLHFPKPVLESEEGTKMTLPEKYTRFLIAHLLCGVGVPEEGVIIMGEHGTAKLDPVVQEELAKISGGRIQFGAGGKLSKPVVPGDYDGEAHGNPRYKGLLEGFHALIKNDLGAVQGQMGGGRGERPEWQKGIERRDSQLHAIAKKLETVRPGITERLAYPFMDYYDFMEVANYIYGCVNGRCDHNLEGWEGQGFMIPEYWDGASAAWVPVMSLQNPGVSPIIAQATYNAIQSGSIKVRRRRLSPAEAWQLRAGDRRKIYDPIVATQILGLEMSKVCECSQKLELHYKDLLTFTDCEINGILEGGGTLTRGESYRVWVNPFDAFRALVADMNGRFIGLAPIKIEHRYDDLEGIKTSIAARNIAMHEELQQVRAAHTRMAQKNEATQIHNVTEIVGRDPLLVRAQKSAAGAELKNAGVADLDFTPEEKPADISFEDILD